VAVERRGEFGDGRRKLLMYRGLSLIGHSESLSVSCVRSTPYLLPNARMSAISGFKIALSSSSSSHITSVRYRDIQYSCS
jgi:hypothetical protein